MEIWWVPSAASCSLGSLDSSTASLTSCIDSADTSIEHGCKESVDSIFSSLVEIGDDECELWCEYVEFCWYSEPGGDQRR